MLCSKCKLPLPTGPAQTCPRCFTVNSPEKPSKPKATRRRRVIEKPAPASEPDTKIDEPASE